MRFLMISMSAALLFTTAQARAADEAVGEEAEEVPIISEGRFGLLLQSWFGFSDDSRFSTGSTGPSFTSSTQPGAGFSNFRLRRAELAYDSKPGTLFKYRLMIDPASNVQGGPIKVSSNSVTVKDILQDVWVGVILPKHEIKVGQFKLPITMEGYGSSSRLDFAERSTLARTFGDQRDMGVMVESAGVPFVEYQVALVNGAGKNSFDNGPRKDVVARLALKPIPGVSVGGSTYLGETYDSSIGAYKMKNRAGVEAAVEQYGAMLKFEYMGGRDDLGSTVDGLVRAKPEGAYVTAGYRFGSAQLVARYDQFKSDTSAELGACQAGGSLAGNARCTKVHSFSAGINYDFHKILHNAKLQLDYYYDVDEVQKKHASEVYLVGQVKL